MTKLRDPLSFAQGIRRASILLGFDGIAAITRRSKRAVRYWSESDRHGVPTIAQCLAIDLAWIGRGGEGAPPMFESYADQLGLAESVGAACYAELNKDIAAAAKDCGEAIASAIEVTAGNASPAKLHRAVAEAEEARGRMTALLRRLTSFLKPAAGAGNGTEGGAR